MIKFNSQAVFYCLGVFECNKLLKSEINEVKVIYVGKKILQTHKNVWTQKCWFHIINDIKCILMMYSSKVIFLLGLHIVTNILLLGCCVHYVN